MRMHISRLPGVVPSVRLTPPLCRGISPCPEHADTLETCTARDLENYMEKETGAKIEASMCMWKSIRSDKHLWKQTPASRSRGGMRRDTEHKWEETQRQRDTYAKMHAPGDTGKDQNQQEPLCGWPDPTLPFRHSKEAQGHLSPVPKAAPSLAKTGSRQQALPNL